MHDLLDAMTTLVSNSPPDKVNQLADTIRDAAGSDVPRQVNAWATTPGTRQRASAVVRAWGASGITPVELAGLLIGVSYGYHRARSEETIELIWTGPSSELVATRKTEQALLQVIKSACEKLFLTSFVAYDVAPIMTALHEATQRGVAISMLLESSDQHGGVVSVDAIGKMRKAFPEAKFYFWGEKNDAFAGGKVHAKVAVADEGICFISSANLTTRWRRIWKPACWSPGARSPSNSIATSKRW